MTRLEVIFQARKEGRVACISLTPLSPGYGEPLFHPLHCPTPSPQSATPPTITFLAKRNKDPDQGCSKT